MALRMKACQLPFLRQIELAGLPTPQPEFYFARPRRYRFDYAFPERKLAMEIEGGTWMRGGGRHSRGAGYEKDVLKYNLAALLGWLVLRATTRRFSPAIRTR